MHIHFHLFLLFASIPFLTFLSLATRHDTLNQASSLSPPQDSLISSPLGIFTAGFYQVGENAYCFAIWFTDPLVDGNFTIVWMANRDQPVNGRQTKLSLLDNGNLVLEDAGRLVVWSSNTESTSFVQLQLHDNGNLVLHTNEGSNIWESFGSPMNTLLPQQSLTKNTRLIASRSQRNYSSGLYKLFFDNDNVLRLIYDTVQITSVFWPPPWLNSWDGGRNTFNDSKIATLDLRGYFLSSDQYQFNTSDYGLGPQRRMTLDHDGNIRVYSLDKGLRIWKITWQVIIQTCKIHGICGPYSLCTYDRLSGPKCSCLPGYKMKNYMDWFEGCVSEFTLLCNGSDSAQFLKHNHVEFYGYDITYLQNYTLEECKKTCLSYCNCKGFQYRFQRDKGVYSCYPKSVLINGYQSIGFEDRFYLKLPKYWPSSSQKSSQNQSKIHCTSTVRELNRDYKKKEKRGWLKYLFWCTVAILVFEIMCVLVFLYKTSQRSSPATQGYHQAATGFKRFTYAELKKATRNFSQEIGRGGSAVVYKGRLSDDRIAAIKVLNEAKQGEAEFLTEVSVIGRLNHGNLIESLGYCAEGKHRVLVYEYLEHGSLEENLYSNKLDWKKRFDIALGTAKGLAYLHEECLEWVLHCDVKPENILLDSNYQPKVADFGLSKLLNRNSLDNLNVSTIRGTRGYMAPEWVSHLPITSKVDVYSYGIVVLEMITGRNPKGLHASLNNGGSEHKMLVTWVMELMHEEANYKETSSWTEQIVDPSMGGDYDVDILKNLVKVALQCAQENKDDRPTMREVTDMLLDEGRYALK